MKPSLYPSLSAFALVLGTLTLVGCGGAVSFSNPKTTDTPPPVAPQVVAGPAIEGSSYGGHAPILTQHIYLLQPGTTGYGSPATSLLGNNGATVDGNGHPLTADTSDLNVPPGSMYDTTDANGYFSLTGAYKCTVGQPVYVYGYGGNIGGGALNNNNIVMLATLGNCPSSGNFFNGSTALQFVYLNEVSTVATAYTFQPFTLVTNNNAWDIGTSNTTEGLVGIANAANTAAQLYDIQGGTQLSSSGDGEGHIANYQTTASGDFNQGNGVVPQATIDSLANIVAYCVDSAPTAVGVTTTQCNSLFNVATDNGETTGTKPIDAATAVINIARFPAGNHSAGTANVDATYAKDIYSIPSGTVPYLPELTKAPHDWTIAINYPGPNNGVTGSSTGGLVTNNNLNSAESIAIDDIGQVWITSQGDPNTSGGYIDKPAIVRWSNLGAQNAINSYTYIPGYVSIDGSNNAWTGNANDAPSALPYSGNGGTGTPIFEGLINGVANSSYGSGYYKAYVVITNQTGDAFFFAGASTITPSGNYDMWEYNPSGSLIGGSPIGISGTTTTTTTPGTGTLTITKATETCTGLLCGIGVGTYKYTFTATNPGTPTGAAALAAGQTVKLTIADHNGGNNWTRLNGNQTVATANGTTFTVTSTTNENISGDATGTGTYATTITGTTTTPGAIPAGDNAGHGAIDSDGDLWITAETPGNTIARITPAGTPLFTSIVTAEQPEFPAIDASNNAWIAIQSTPSQIYVVSPAGGQTILTSASTGAALTSTFGAAVDGNGNVWFANRCGNYGACDSPALTGDNSIVVINGGVSTPGTVNTAISPPTNYIPEAQYPADTGTEAPILNGSLNLAIDPSGNVWITNYTGGGVVELIGAAAPVVTPLSLAAGTGKLGAKP